MPRKNSTKPEEFSGVRLHTTDISVDRFLKRHAMSFKKTLHAAEQERPDVAEARQHWKAGQPQLDAKRLVFVDETGTSTKMVRTAVAAVAAASG